MKNFIFKSSQDFGLIKNVFNKLDAIQSELRHQRSEHSDILRILHNLCTDKDLQQQVDQYFEEPGTLPHPGETSPQTDLEDK